MENHHAVNGKIHYFYGHFPQFFFSLPGRVAKLREHDIRVTSGDNRYVSL